MVDNLALVCAHVMLLVCLWKIFKAEEAERENMSGRKPKDRLPARKIDKARR